MTQVASSPPRWRSRIAGIGVALPARNVGTDEWTGPLSTDIKTRLERLTGIRSRRICGPDETALSMALDAARQGLATSGLAADQLDVVISTGISHMGEDLAVALDPPLSLSIKRGIGAERALHFDLTNACAGLQTGVLVLDQLIRAGRARCGLVVSGEFISNIGVSARDDIRSADDPQLASLTVGDAGAALVLQRAERSAPGIEICDLRTFAHYSDLCFGRPRRRGPGTAMFTQAGELHAHAIAKLGPVMAEVLEQAGLSVQDIEWIIPHQTSRRAIRLGARELFGPLEPLLRGRIVCNVEEFGNTASTTHVLALHRLLVEGRIGEGRIMFVTFASGLAVGITVLRLDHGLQRAFHG